jgi:hypothetical protein
VTGNIGSCGRRTATLTGVAIGVAVLALAACTYRGGLDRPYTLKATWFSYVNGDDLRRRCANIEDHWEVRLIYNGHYEEQVRTYDLIADGTGGAEVTARATPEDAGSLTGLTSADPLAPWRWARSETRLDPGARARLAARLAESGVFRSAPAGLDLKSWGSYWVAVACRGDTVTFNAWAYPSDRWAAQDLRRIVAPLDATGVPVYGPKAPDFAEAPIHRRPDEGRGVHFLLTTGDNGLAGPHLAF